MANNTEIIIRVTAEGVKIVEGQVDKLASSTNRATKASQKHTQATQQQTQAQNQLNVSHQHYDRGMKGVAGATANGTKAFSKMRSELGGSSGLVAAYATIAANVFAATAAFGALQRAAQLQTLISNIDAVGYSVGINMTALADSLKESTGQALSLDQALRTASFGVSAGFNTTQLNNLAEVGKKAAIALGRDVGDAVDRLTRGVAKLEPEILDELGIIVRLDDATQEYAASVGKTVQQLTAFEKQQAFANAVIDQGLEKYADIEGAANPFDELAATLQDLKQGFLTIINNGLLPFIQALADSKTLLLGLILALTNGVVKTAFPVLSNLAKKQELVATKAQENSKVTQKAANKEARALAQNVSLYKTLTTKAADRLKTSLQGNKMVDAEKQLTKILQGRAGVQARADNNQLKWSDKKIAAYKQETKQLQSQLKVIQRAAMQQGGIKPKGGAFQLKTFDEKKAIAQQKLARRQAAAASSLVADSSLKNQRKQFIAVQTAITAYSNAIKKARLDTQAFGISVSGTTVVTRTFGSVLRTVGIVGQRAIVGLKAAFASLLSVIPILGQILFIWSLISPLLKKAAEALGFVSKQTKEMKEKQKELTESLVNYNKVLDRSVVIEERLIDAKADATQISAARVTAIIAEAGALKEVIEKLDDYRNARDIAMRDSPRAFSTNERVSEFLERFNIGDINTITERFQNIQQAINDIEFPNFRNFFNEIEKANTASVMSRWLFGDNRTDMRKIQQELAEEFEGIELLSRERDILAGGDRWKLNIDALKEMDSAEFSKIVEIAKNESEELANNLERMRERIEEYQDLRARMATVFNPEQVTAMYDSVGRAAAGEINTLITIAQGGGRIGRSLAEAFGALGEEGQVNAERITEVINKLGGAVDQDPSALVASLDGVGNEIKTIIEEVSGGEKLTRNNIFEILYQIITRTSEGTITLSNDLQSLRSAITGSEEGINNFINGLTTSNTSAGKFRDTLTPLVASIRALNESGENVDWAAELEKLPKAFRDAAATNFPTKPIAEQVELEYNRLNAIEEENSLIEEQLKNLDIQIKGFETLQKIDKFNLSLANEIYNIEKQTLSTKIDQLKNEMSTYDGYALGTEQARERERIQNEINRSTAELNALQQAQNRNSIIGLEYSVKLHEDLLKISEQENKLNKDKADNLQKEFELQLKIQNARQGRGFKLTEAQSAELRVRSAELALTVAEQSVKTAQAELAINELNLEMERERFRIAAERFNVENRAAIEENPELKQDPEALSPQFKQLAENQRTLANLAVASAEQGVRAARIGLNGVIAELRNSALPQIEGFYADLVNATDVLSQQLVLRADEIKNSWVGAFEVASIAASTFGESIKSINETAANMSGFFGNFVRGISTASASFKEMRTASLKDIVPKGQSTREYRAGLEADLQGFQEQKTQASFEPSGYSDTMATADQGIEETQQKLDNLATVTSAKSAAMSTALAAVGGMFAAVGQMAMESANQQVAAIDKAIAAEQKRDGKSKESIAKIKALEAKKDSIARKAFEKNKKMQMAATIANTASAVMGVLAHESGRLGFFASIPAMIIAAMGAVQLAMIAKQSYQSPSGSISESGPSSVSMGERKSTIDLARSESAAGELAYLRGERGIGSAENFKPAFMGMKYRAEGGATTGYVVGEQGPELFVPSTPGTVVPNNQITTQPSANVTFNINAIDASGVQDMLLAQRGQIIGMIREAANSYGDDFLENVSVGVFTPEVQGARKA